MNASRLDWYVKRLRAMSAAEIASRAIDSGRKATWTKRQVIPGQRVRRPEVKPGIRFTAILPEGTRERIPASAKEKLIAEAEEILKGRIHFLGVERNDLVAPDWFYDPVTGRRAPCADYSFRIEHRSEAITGNVKQVWELSRLQYLTQLAAAWYVSGDDAYAQAVDEHLRSWWKENPFLSGVNWTSGIEVGLRLISLTWIRRLLDEWPGIQSLFEDNDTALAQIKWHQEFLAAFRSRGSSANNHVIAEAAGQLVASCAFDWFKRSEHWHVQSALLLERELELNTFPSGINRELASEYQGFVAELGLVAAVEAQASGHPLSPGTWELLTAMFDASAAVADELGNPPRQGDGDEGRALVVDSPEANRPSVVRSIGAALVGATEWWPPVDQSVESILLAAMSTRHVRPRGGPTHKPSHFADAGITILRTTGTPEVWCRCDGGPHGFLSIAGHAHADALSVEIRHGGVGILIDPGTYCYHGEPGFRRYFRSTLAHNTIEINSQDQSASGGPFLWLRHARTSGVEIQQDASGSIVKWSAQHDGYEVLDPPVGHRRTVEMESRARRIDILDVIETRGSYPGNLMFHFGPSVDCELDHDVAELRWRGSDGVDHSAVMELDPGASWSTHRGESDPILGWYSSSFGSVQPTTVLRGRLLCKPGKTELVSSIRFREPRPAGGITFRDDYTARAV